MESKFVSFVCSDSLKNNLLVCCDVKIKSLLPNIFTYIEKCRRKSKWKFGLTVSSATEVGHSCQILLLFLEK